MVLAKQLESRLLFLRQREVYVVPGVLAQNERSLGTHYSLLVAETHDYRGAVGLRCQYK